MSTSKALSKPLVFYPGETIHEDDPYACCISSDAIESTCSFCISGNSSVSCNECGKIYYCSKKCRKKDLLFHGLECKVFNSAGPDEDIPDEEARMVIRALDRFIRERDSNGVSEAIFFTCKRNIYDLLSHVAELSPQELAQAKDRSQQIMSLVTPFVDTNLDEVVEMLQKCRINCHSLVDHNDLHFFSRGRTVYLAASKTNHTCVTNSDYVQMFDGRKILLRAIQYMEITDPLELTIHYMPPTLPYKSRFYRCLHSYYFICSCKKCVWQARNPETDQVDEKLVAEIEQTFDEYHSFEEWYVLGKQILERLKSFSEKNFYVYWILVQLQPTCLELGKYEESIEYGIRATNGSDSLLSLEPVFNFLCQAMVKLGWHKSWSPQHARFLETYRFTKTLYSITHGPGHKIIQNLRKLRGTWWAKRPSALTGLFKKDGSENIEHYGDAEEVAQA